MLCEFVPIRASVKSHVEISTVGFGLVALASRADHATIAEN
jgi:hypothetical protein